MTRWCYPKYLQWAQPACQGTMWRVCCDFEVCGSSQPGCKPVNTNPEALKYWFSIKHISSNVWVRYFVCYFKSYLWNSKPNILPIHWKLRILYNVEKFRSLRFKSSYAFLKRPQMYDLQLQMHAVCSIISCMVGRVITKPAGICSCWKILLPLINSFICRYIFELVVKKIHRSSFIVDHFT